jgi:hypothetical protein
VFGAGGLTVLGRAERISTASETPILRLERGVAGFCFAPAVRRLQVTATACCRRVDNICGLIQCRSGCYTSFTPDEGMEKTDENAA